MKHGGVKLPTFLWAGGFVGGWVSERNGGQAGGSGGAQLPPGFSGGRCPPPSKPRHGMSHGVTCIDLYEIRVFVACAHVPPVSVRVSDP